jgi:hypothetical protein
MMGSNHNAAFKTAATLTTLTQKLELKDAEANT